MLEWVQQVGRYLTLEWAQQGGTYLRLEWVPQGGTYLTLEWVQQGGTYLMLEWVQQGGTYLTLEWVQRGGTYLMLEWVQQGGTYLTVEWVQQGGTYLTVEWVQHGNVVLDSEGDNEPDGQEAGHVGEADDRLAPAMHVHQEDAHIVEPHDQQLQRDTETDSFRDQQGVSRSTLREEYIGFRSTWPLDLAPAPCLLICIAVFVSGPIARIESSERQDCSLKPWPGAIGSSTLVSANVGTPL